MQRNITLDYFKILLSILVVTIHCQNLFAEESLVGWLISNGIARIAVPCFFVICGYYIHDKLTDRKRILSYIKHILVVYFIWSLAYLPTYIDSIEYRSLITFALMGYYHLWYLPALALAIFALYLMKKYVDNNRSLLSTALLLFVLGYTFELYEVPYRLVCNGLIFGFPFLTLGYLIKDVDIVKNWKNISNLYIVLLITLGSLLVESYWGYEDQTYQNLYLSLFILCPCLIVLVLKKSVIKNVDSNILPQLSSGIYITHIFVISLIVPLSEVGNIDKLAAIIAMSIVISIFIILINKRIKILL